ncbi:PD-(D/E)XK nuclease superfamily protein [Caminibacter sp.]
MIKGGVGGYNTKTGLYFEGKVDLITFIQKLPEYSIKETPYTRNKKNKWYEIFYKEQKVADAFRKNALYTYLEVNGVDWREIISKQLLPDDAIYVVSNNTVFILEVKYQEVSGSVDEKLQTCDFKKKQYMKHFAPINRTVDYIYILNDWFKKPEYKDVLDYIITMGCRYYFNYLPLYELGLPVPKEKEK